MIVLGIDTSCDDTCVAVLRNGKEILSNIVSSQVSLHTLFGGVVPEIASRKHVELIDGIYKQALAEAGLGLDDIDVVAVTQGPGLIGSLLVGLSFAKGLAMAAGKPLIGINHVEAHGMSIFLQEQVAFPFITLIVSGGHTMILLFEEACTFRVLGSTRDDAAGEAFDKIAKFLHLGYPGGQAIEEASRGGKGDRVPFPRPIMDEPHYDFSFSGLKTAFINYVKKNGLPVDEKKDVLASFQEAACDVLVYKTLKAAKTLGVRRIVMGGGVASNGRLREMLAGRARDENISVHIPPPSFCTDNGAMVAVTGSFYAQRGLFSPLDVKAYSRIVFGC
jgi:N6-L-threonylcarbamoyladenine synthase